MLKLGDELCERGNTLLQGEDGQVMAWLDLGEDKRLEVSWCPANYPAMNVRVVKLTDEELADHINNRLQGWYVRKINIDGVKADWSDHVASPR